ncbi:hypothetical protein LCGC14_1793360, partial [marine sediment metagenome]
PLPNKFRTLKDAPLHDRSAAIRTFVSSITLGIIMILYTIPFHLSRYSILYTQIYDVCIRRTMYRLGKINPRLSQGVLGAIQNQRSAGFEGAKNRQKALFNY